MKTRMQSPIMQDYIKNNDPDIITLVETKIKNTNSLPNLASYFKFSKGANIQNSHPSGGIVFYFHERLKRSIQRLKICKKHNIMWIKISNPHGRDLVISTIYCRNAEQKYEEEISEFYEQLTQDTLKYTANSDVLILGDFNARLGLLTGDHAENSNKEEFLAFLHTTKMSNLNLLHIKGEYTYQDDCRGGKSIIDYGIFNSESLDRVSQLRKLDEVFGSDHRALEAHIKSNFRLELNHDAVIRKWSRLTHKNEEAFVTQIQNKLKDFKVPKLPPNLSKSARLKFMNKIHRKFLKIYNH